jgi:hypothetical protein
MNLKHYSTITTLIFGTLVSSIVQAQFFEPYPMEGINSSPSSINSSPYNMNNSIYNMNNSPSSVANSPYNMANSPYNINATNGVYDNNGNRVGYTVVSPTGVVNIFNNDGGRTGYVPAPTNTTGR